MFELDLSRKCVTVTGPFDRFVTPPTPAPLHLLKHLIQRYSKMQLLLCYALLPDRAYAEPLYASAGGPIFRRNPKPEITILLSVRGN